MDKSTIDPIDHPEVAVQTLRMTPIKQPSLGTFVLKLRTSLQATAILLSAAPWGWVDTDHQNLLVPCQRRKHLQQRDLSVG